jgi:thiosulfate reductase cytochrome b subunit
MARAAPAYIPDLAAQVSELPATQRHTAFIRITHWVNALSFFGLLISGFAILLAHPRFYWGEAGGIGTPSVVDLPLPFMKGGPSGWGRNLHFFAAWVCVINGSLYGLSGFLTPHFRKNLLPAKADLERGSISRLLLSHLRFERPGVETALAYNPLERVAYLLVVFVLLPLMIWTGFAMSPAIVSAFPAIVTVLGGQQSARTIHFFVSDLLLLFVLVHLIMVYLAGFRDRVRAMITGRCSARVEHP